MPSPDSGLSTGIIGGAGVAPDATLVDLVEAVRAIP